MEYIVQHSRIYNALKEAVIEGLDRISELQAQNKYIGTYFDFPKMSWFESGLPNFSFTLLSEGPTDYKGPFGRDISIESMKTWNVFWELVPEYSELRRYYGFQNEEDIPLSGSKKTSTFFTIKCLVDRYIHIYGQPKFNEDAFLSVYIEWERCAFLNDLPFNIFIPLIYTTFDFDKLDSGEEVAIERIPEAVQLARINKTKYSLSRYESVTGAATHALVLKYWTIVNASWIERLTTLSKIEAFSTAIEKVEFFLAAFRAVTGQETGYNQIVVVPESWGDMWDAHLPDVYVGLVREYPDHFERGGWRQKPPVISGSNCEAIFSVYKTLSNSQSNKLRLAARRLNAAYLRRTEDDAILDVTIGLESLFADDSRSEIVYRLAVRLSSLSALEKFDGYSSAEVFDLCKRIYDYRSAVVHGSHRVDKKRMVRITEEAEPVPALTLGLSLLRYAIQIMARHSDLLDTKKIDQCLLERFTADSLDTPEPNKPLDRSR